MKQQHHPKDIRTYSKGVNRDVDDELMGMQEGQAIDSCNMRSIPMDGDNFSRKKINGEEIMYPNVDNRCVGGTGLPLPLTYECIGIQEINGHIVEFWADESEVEPSFVRIDGLIVLMSSDFPITVKHPLQIAKNESCIGGEIYITDYHVTPMFFNIQDLLLNSGVDSGGKEGDCSDKYFDAFNVSEHLLILTRVLDHPVFIKLTTLSSGADYVFGSGGLPVGYYTYSHRYVSSSGERTAWSAPTPQIPVVKTVSSKCTNYPWSKTISKDPDISSPSINGAHIRFRINNEGNYDFIEVRRDAWQAGDPLGTPSISVICGKIDIDNGLFGVVDIYDRGGFEEDLSGEDIISVMAAITRAKAIRYFNQSLYLMNVEYASRDISEDVEMVDEGNPDVVFPTIEKIGISGHSDPYNATYYKHTMLGEKTGYGIILWDEQGQWTYAKPINGATNFAMPNRRDVASSLTEGTSYKGTCRAAATNGSVEQTHEIFDLTSARDKDNKCLYANILDGGSKSNLFGKLNISGCPTPEDEGLTSLGAVTGQNLGHRPFTPTSQDDLNCDYTNYAVNLKVENSGAPVDYNPNGFEPNYFSSGVAFKGLDKFPDWAKAFSIVRTDPAERVVAQGLGYYSLITAKSGGNTGKQTDEFAAYFPDLDESTGIDPSIIEDIKLNPSSYELQLVAPLGFFTEVYSFDADNYLTNFRDSGVDLITYARIIRDNGEINPNENSSMGIADGLNRYVSFGKWRASSQFSIPFPSGVATGGNDTFGIDNIVDYTSSSGRSKYFRIKTDRQFYTQFYALGRHNGDHPDVQNWHEPMYVINIVKKVADVVDSNITQYNFTGNYQKLEATIGISDGSDSQTYLLTDERWEDCIPTINGQTVNDYDSLERFVYIDDGTGQQKAWVNVTNKTAPQIVTILNSLQASGSAVVTDSSGSYTVHGVYKHSESVDFTAPEFFVNFDWFDTSYDRSFFVPDTEYKIIVKYDNRIPVRVFGGDTWLGESTWAVKDKVYNSDAFPANSSDDMGDGVGDLFSINVAFPYRKFHLNPRIFIVNQTTGANKIQDLDTFKFSNGVGGGPSEIRQLITMWSAETRINLSFAFNDEGVLHSSDQYFPLKNYVMRPYNYRENEFSNGATAVYSDNNIHADYETKYGDEYLLWGMGGFRFRPQTNIDYSKKDNTKSFSSVPKVGFEEQNLYCTRVIWSEKRPINIQDTPSVRTFPSQNTFDVTDDTGEIKFAYDSISEKGTNLYAFTDSGCVLLLVDKRVIHEINANELATVGSDIGGILNELWINKDIGMADEMWRSAAEYSESLYFCNYNSAYSFTGNQIQDIGRAGYHSKIYPEYLDILGRGYSDRVTGVYDVLHNEYWINFKKKASIGEEGGIEFGEGINHNALGDALNVVDVPFDPAADSNDDWVGVNNGDTIIIGECFSGNITYLGGSGNNLLDGTKEVSICNDCDSDLNVKYYNGDSDTFVLLATIQNGECYCFSSSSNDGTSRPIWVAEQCNPFGEGEEPFEDFLCPTLVWNQAGGFWEGGYDYKFDRFISFDNKTFGVRGVETYLLDVGRIINGGLIEASVISASAVPQPADKEFVRIRVNSDNKPVKIEFFNNLSQLLNNNVQAELDTTTNPQALKDYYGFEQYIPRKLAAPNNRMQGRLLIFKIIHNLDEDFRITTTDVQYKSLK